MKIENLETFSPELYSNAIDLYSHMLPLALVILIIGMTLGIYKGSFSGDPAQMLRVILTGAVIAIVISMFPEWVNLLQLASHDITNEIGVIPSKVNELYVQILVDTRGEGKQSIGLWDLFWSDKMGIGEAIAYAFIYLASQFAWAVMWLFTIVQQALLIYSISLAPVFIAFFILEPMKGVAAQYILRLISVILWPLGWSIGGMVTKAIIQKGVDAPDTIIGGSQFHFWIFVLTLWIIFSAVASPLLISKLLTKGVNAGTVLFSGFVGALAQGVVSGGYGGATAHMVGGSSKAVAAGAVASGATGYISESLGRSNVLAASGIGMAVGMSSGSPRNRQENSARARELYEQS